MRVALICSGDAQVYGMASLLLGMAEEGDEIEVVPGVTAALSAAAVLGSPLCGDFAVVSLSDQLTPWATIERRLRAAGRGVASRLRCITRVVATGRITSPAPARF